MGGEKAGLLDSHTFYQNISICIPFFSGAGLVLVSIDVDSYFYNIVIYAIMQLVVF